MVLDQLQQLFEPLPIPLSEMMKTGTIKINHVHALFEDSKGSPLGWHPVA